MPQPTIEVSANNLLAIEVLDILGIDSPTQQQIDVIELLTAHLAVPIPLLFNKQLTRREQSCLYFAARGRSAAETAHLLKIQKDTVDQYRKSILRKLNCKNMVQAIFVSLQLGKLPL